MLHTWPHACTCHPGPFFDPAETATAARRVRVKRAWRRIWSTMRRIQAHRISKGGVPC